MSVDCYVTVFDESFFYQSPKCCCIHCACLYMQVRAVRNPLPLQNSNPDQPVAPPDQQFWAFCSQSDCLFLDQFLWQFHHFQFEAEKRVKNNVFFSYQGSHKLYSPFFPTNMSVWSLSVPKCDNSQRDSFACWLQQVILGLLTLVFAVRDDNLVSRMDFVRPISCVIFSFSSAAQNQPKNLLTEFEVIVATKKNKYLSTNLLGYEKHFFTMREKKPEWTDTNTDSGKYQSEIWLIRKWITASH